MTRVSHVFAGGMEGGAGGGTGGEEEDDMTSKTRAVLVVMFSPCLPYLARLIDLHMSPLLRQAVQCGVLERRLAEAKSVTAAEDRRWPTLAIERWAWGGGGHT